MSDRIEVHVRARPTTNPGQWTKIDGALNELTIAKNNGDGYKFKFDRVYLPSCSQADVFQNSLAGIIENVMNGVNGTLMVYGQTGAGKTHTITGKLQEAEQRGLCIRAISQLFKNVEASDSSFTIRVSYMEVYKERMYDLLGEDTRKIVSSVFHDEHGTTVLKDLSRKIVRNEEEALMCIFEGESNRAIGSHEMNYNSSRSHCLVTFYVEARIKSFDEDAGIQTEKVTNSKLNLVDLAGSERVMKTNSEGILLEEAKSINKSLTFLEQVVIALADKKREHIPYRQSQLTQYLKDSLGGNCKTLMIACVWPEDTHTEQTIATLKFATRMMRVKNKPSQNFKSGVYDSLMVQEYKREIATLRAEIALRDSLVYSQEAANVFQTELGMVHTPFTPAQMESIGKSVDQFVASGDVNFIKPQSVRHVLAMQMIMRDRILAGGSAPTPRSSVNSARGPIHAELKKSQSKSSARTINSETKSDDDEDGVNRQGPEVNDTVSVHIPDAAAREEGRQDVHSKNTVEDEQDREAKFEEFKSTHPVGKEFSDNLAANKASLLDMYHRTKSLRAELNTVKLTLDDLIGNESDDVDQIKELKKKYKTLVAEIKELKGETTFANELLKSCKEKLSQAFDEWYAAGCV